MGIFCGRWRMVEGKRFDFGRDVGFPAFGAGFLRGCCCLCAGGLVFEVRDGFVGYRVGAAVWGFG